MNWWRPLLLMFYAPARGMAEVRDRASLGAAALLALVAQGAHMLYTQWPVLAGSRPGVRAGVAALSVVLSSAGTLLLIGLIFVPLAIALANLFERRASVGLVVKQEYVATASTIFYAVAAASVIALPLAFVAKVTGLEAATRESIATVTELMNRMPPEGLSEADTQLVAATLPRLLVFLLIQPLFLFSLWAVAALRAVFRLSWWRSLVVVTVSSFLMFLASPLLVVFSTVLASPFLLLLLFFLLRGYFGEVSRAQRARASFRQNLEAATLNPADASAHYNLGLIHLQRKELDEARSRFQRAIEIDADEVDSHFQLGRIARTQERLPDAIGHFGEVVTRDPTHAQHEIWREIGATYLDAAQFSDAHDAIERFLEHRQLDPEGLYLMGRTLAGMGRPREAAASMEACIEAVKTAPAYKYRTDKRWLNEAQQFLRTLA